MSLAKETYPEPVRAVDVTRDADISPIVQPQRAAWPIVVWSIVATIGILLLVLGARRTPENAIANPELWFASWPFLIAGWIGISAWVVKGMR